MPWPRSIASPAATCTSSTTTCWATVPLLRPCSTVCAAWGACGRRPRPVDGVLRGDLIERAAEAGLRSLFVGFETLDPGNLKLANKGQNLGRDYDRAIARLDDLGVMVNGSFVFGLDADGPDVFDRTVDWAVSRGLTTATFHIATPYPGTAFYDRIARQGRLLHHDWDR